jgi:acetyl esterase/lipase
MNLGHYLYCLVVSLWILSKFEEGVPQNVHHFPKANVSEQQNIAYISKTAANFHPSRHLLDMYWPAVAENCPVVVFIHGGTWMTGDKNLYADLGRNFAGKGIVTAIINYRLGDQVQYDQMAEDCAASVKWVSGHAKQYNGNPDKIIVSGHSAGAHLAALISLDPDYMRSLHISNPIKACMLIDAFGLNMDTFIRSPFGQGYMAYIEKVFTRNEATWEKASPVSHINERSIPFFIATGSQSYPFLLMDNEIFVTKLKAIHGDVTYEKIAGKSHSEMITQLKHPNNQLYGSMIRFIEKTTPVKQ